MPCLYRIHSGRAYCTEDLGKAALNCRNEQIVLTKNREYGIISFASEEVFSTLTIG